MRGVAAPIACGFRRRLSDTTVIVSILARVTVGRFGSDHSVEHPLLSKLRTSHRPSPNVVLGAGLPRKGSQRMGFAEHQLRIHVPVEFGIQVLPKAWRAHVGYGLGTGLELRWSQPRELKTRIRQARWSQIFELTYNHDCSTSAWDLWAIGSLCLLSSVRSRGWATLDALLRRARLPHGYEKYLSLVTDGLTHARASKFEGAPSPADCAAIGAATLGLVIVNHVNLGGSAQDRQAIEHLQWLRALCDATGRKALIAELEEHWRSRVIAERATITRSLERLSSRA